MRETGFKRRSLASLALFLKEIALLEEEMGRIVECRRADLENEISSHKGTLAKIRKEDGDYARRLAKRKETRAADTISIRDDARACGLG